MGFKNLKSSKGFTLTELIIVIVIIGILAAVLVPTITKYVERARYSNDISDARNMNMQLSIEAYDTNQDYFEPTYVIGFLQMNGFSVKTKSKNNSFCYNPNTNTIEVVSDVSLGLSATNPTNNQHPLLANPLNKIRSLDNYFYIDQGTSSFSKAVDTITNLVEYASSLPNDGDIDTIEEKMGKLYGDVTKELPTSLSNFTAFDPATTVYVTEKGYFTTATDKTTLTNVIIARGTTVIPEAPTNFANLTGITSVYVPASVTNVADNSIFEKVTKTNVDIVLSNPSINDKFTGFKDVDLNAATNYTKYNKIENVVIIYTAESSTENKVTITNEGNQPENVSSSLAKGIPADGKFSVKFGSGLIKVGSTIDIKNYTNENGILTYDVRIFDVNGILYARGVFKYWYI